MLNQLLLKSDRPAETVTKVITFSMIFSPLASGFEFFLVDNYSPAWC
ncbi:MAG: hypothetical protein N2235_21495 [Fischerella sp.]|nr:hypothetical protein [Fischerella sp.]